MCCWAYFFLALIRCLYLLYNTCSLNINLHNWGKTPRGRKLASVSVTVWAPVELSMLSSTRSSWSLIFFISKLEMSTCTLQHSEDRMRCVQIAPVMCWGMHICVCSFPFLHDHSLCVGRWWVFLLHAERSSVFLCCIRPSLHCYKEISETG